MKKLYILFLLFNIFLLKAQVTFKAVLENNNIDINDRISIKFSVQIKNEKSPKIKDFVLPNFENFQVIEKPRTYLRANKTIEYVYGVILMPMEEGRHTIGSASITVNNRKYTTKPVKVNIRKEERAGHEIHQNRSIFLTLDVSNKSPYINESIISTVTLYAKSLSNMNINPSGFKIPDFKGFTVRPINSVSQEFRQKKVGDDYYYAMDIAAYVLFPIKSGTLKITPFELSVTVMSPYLFDDDKDISLKTELVSLNVFNLPKRDKPKNFKGAVGNFELTAFLDNKEIDSDGSTTITTEIKGIGNFGMISIPEVNVSNDIEKYKPKEIDDYSPTLIGLSGEISSSVILVPQKPGEFNINLEPFSYFDPEEKKYNTITVDSLILNVNDGLDNNNDEGSNISYINEVRNFIGAKKSNKMLIIFVIAVFLTSLGFILFIFKKILKSRKKSSEEKNKTILEDIEIIENLNPINTEKSEIKSEELEKIPIIEKFEASIDIQNRIKDLEFCKNTNQEKFYECASNILNELPESEEINQLKIEVQKEKYSPIKNHRALDSIIERLKRIISE